MDPIRTWWATYLSWREDVKDDQIVSTMTSSSLDLMGSHVHVQYLYHVAVRYLSFLILLGDVLMIRLDRSPLLDLCELRPQCSSCFFRPIPPDTNIVKRCCTHVFLMTTRHPRDITTNLLNWTRRSGHKIIRTQGTRLRCTLGDIHYTHTSTKLPTWTIIDSCRLSRPHPNVPK